MTILEKPSYNLYQKKCNAQRSLTQHLSSCPPSSVTSSTSTTIGTWRTTTDWWKQNPW